MFSSSSHDGRVMTTKPALGFGDPMGPLFSGFSIIPRLVGKQFLSTGIGCMDRIIGDFELIYMAGGMGTVTIAGHVYHCKYPDLVLIPPFTRHSIEAEPGVPFCNYWIHFDLIPLYRHDLFLDTVFPGDHGRFVRSLPLDFKDMFDDAYGLYQAGRPQAAAVVRMLLGYVFARLGTDAPAGSGKKRYAGPGGFAKIDACADFVHSRIDGEVRVSDLCECAALSRSALFLLFRRVLGMTPNGFVRYLRLRHAEQLLLTTDLSVKEIGVSAGFGSAAYFSDAFKKRYGVSPGEYKRVYLYRAIRSEGRC